METRKMDRKNKQKGKKIKYKREREMLREMHRREIRERQKS